jgi:hypothetical protein
MLLRWLFDMEKKVNSRSTYFGSVQLYDASAMMVKMFSFMALMRELPMHNFFLFPKIFNISYCPGWPVTSSITPSVYS